MKDSAVHATEALLFFTLLQLAVIVLAGRFGGWAAQRLGQAAVVGEIVVGILLGPTLFGAVAPQAFAQVFLSTPPQPLNILAQVGLLLLMFQIGLEFEFAHLTEPRNRRAMLLVAGTGIAAPFALGAAFALVLPQGYWGPAGQSGTLVGALFLATALAITAMPVLGRILMELGLTRSWLGVIAISAAAVNDVMGWLALALVTTLATAQFSGAGFGLRVLAVLGFCALCWWVVRPLLGRWVDRQMQASQRTPATVQGVVLACIFLAGMATYGLGIFAIFGGFMLGVLLHDRSTFAADWKEHVGHFVNVFFLPIFFTYTGLRTDVGSLADVQAVGWCVALIGVATLGKFGGCYLAARLAGLARPEAKALGIMMNTRGLMELVVINVGYDLGVIGREMFTMLVLMAIVTTVVTTPALRRWLPATRLEPKAPEGTAPARPAP